MARIALILVFLLVLVSAYLRLLHSGIGCDDWPACYGRIGETPGQHAEPGPFEATPGPGGVGRDGLAPAGATLMHRLVASVLGLLVVLLTVKAFASKRNRMVSLALLALTVFLATLGLKSGSLHSPAVVMGNLAGGFSMLALLGWVVFAASRPEDQTSQSHPRVRGWAVAAIVFLCAQILLGGITSANFAATACQSLPDCHGSWLPGPALVTALNLQRQHPVNEFGVAIGGDERAAIHKTHRLGALATMAALLVTGIAALRADRRFRAVAIGIIFLVVVEFAVGIAAIVTQLPIALAVAHNGLAALLLLSLIKLLMLDRRVAAL